jgi:hypothetical protein
MLISKFALHPKKFNIGNHSHVMREYLGNKIFLPSNRFNSDSVEINHAWPCHNKLKQLYFRKVGEYTQKSFVFYIKNCLQDDLY